MSTEIFFSTKLPTEVREETIKLAYIETIKKVNWVPEGDISLAFVSRAESQRLNSQYAGNDYPTDVLSFPYREEGVIENEFSGEIVICSNIARAQAKEYGTDLESEATLLVVHGILHIYGLDHQNKDSKTSFELIQNDIMKSLNLKNRKMPW